MRAKEVLGVVESDNTALYGSHESTLKINKIGGVCVQGENPTPTNPQEIKKSVVSEIKTHGKNFWKYGDISNATQSGISWGVPKGTYIFSCSTQTFDLTLRIYFADGTSKVVNFTKNATVFTLEDDVVSFNYNNPSGNAIVGIQIEEGTVATEYEPYTESVVTLSQPIELYGIGDVQDTIEGGKVKERLYKITSNSCDFDTTNLLGSIALPNNMAVKTDWNIEYKNIISNMFSTVMSRNNVVKEKSQSAIAIATTDSGVCRVLFKIIGIEQTASAYNAFLANTPLEVVFERATYTTEDLPLTDQIALSCLKTFHGVTYVETDGEVQPTFNSDYATNLDGAITLQAHADNKIGRANTLVNRAEGESDVFEVRVEHGLMYLYKDDVLHGVLGANNVTTNGTTYKTMNVRAEEDADFIALTNKKTNAVCYYMNINKVPFTSNNYTEAHYFAGDARFTGNIHANDWIFSENLQADASVLTKFINCSGEVRGDSLQINKIGVNGGALQAVEWVYDSNLQRWVLCTVTE